MRYTREELEKIGFKKAQSDNSMMKRYYYFDETTDPTRYHYGFVYINEIGIDTGIYEVDENLSMLFSSSIKAKESAKEYAQGIRKAISEFMNDMRKLKLR